MRWVGLAAVTLSTAAVCPASFLAAQDPRAEAVDFVRDVRPILRAHCLKCHGPEKPKGQLRLDVRLLALKGGVSGKVILPGKGGESPLVKLLLEEDAEARMPQKAPRLAREKIDTLRRWIDAGAAWPDEAAGEARLEKHWAYVKPVRPALPKVKNTAWVRNPIDGFILARLEKEGLVPSPEASKETLLRRVSLDLTGLPPSPDEVDAFLSDAGPDAYERLVERLLASPHYGERWARPWLDLARYADTNGFNFDSRRTMWKYRDWVIDVLNRDLPFDRFSVEQIAGDLLPDATVDQKVATGFHRNTMFNEEGGVDGEEAHWEVLIDRVNTTGAVWLGTTVACTQCHNHKYDPFSQKEFYGLLAFFDNTVYARSGPEPQTQRFVEPKIDLATPEQKAEHRRIVEEITREEKALKGLEAAPAAVAPHLLKTLDVPYEKRAPTERNNLVVFYRTAAGELKPLADRLLKLHADLDRIGFASALVIEERPSMEPPSTYFRVKGGFTNRGEKVHAGVPASLHPMRAGWPQNRLGLARWLVDEENPLVARVAVNRFWGEIFGRPIVDTPEDFGTQGQLPDHPELLDWLATEFVRLAWSVKAVHRAIVTSSTYRQSSRLTRELLERDPENRLLARGPRYRMEAEMIRDSMLAAAGLLSRRVGGPSVFPLQADTSGVIAINKVDTSWAPSPGEDRYRRGLYTHWRRTAPYLAFSLFDAPSRECCSVRRVRTNTPLQALSALNDPAHFEAARGLGRRVVREAATTSERAVLAFRLCTARRPDAEEVARIAAAFERERARFAADPGSARAIFKGWRIAAPDSDLPDYAGWVMVANALLNLDETMTKE